MQLCLNYLSRQLQLVGSVVIISSFQLGSLRRIALGVLLEKYHCLRLEAPVLHLLQVGKH